MKKKYPSKDDMVFNKLFDSLSFYRGRLIQEYIVIEEWMDIIIANYFFKGSTPTQKEEFYALFLDTDFMTWNKKKEIVLYLTSRYCPVFRKKDEENIKTKNKGKNKRDKPSFATRLQTIISERNIIAHRKFNLSVELLEQAVQNYSGEQLMEIPLNKMEGKKTGLQLTPFILSKEIVQNKIDECRSLANCFNEINLELQGKIK